MIRLNILSQKGMRVPQLQIKKLFDGIMKQESDKSTAGDINLIFTTDREIKKLNRKYRKKEKPTDVLSFKYENYFGRDGVFGEIYVSTDTARKQAQEYGHTLNQEFLRLFCHGLLHLMGYDHKKPLDRKKMKAKESLYLNLPGLI